MGGGNVLKSFNGEAIRSLGVFSMDVAPHIGQCSFFVKNGMTTMVKVVTGMKSAEIQKSRSSANPNQIISFIGLGTK